MSDGERAPTDSCPLSLPEQRRNLVLFAACTGLQYLAAPVLYIGVTHGSLCERLGADSRTSNLPATLYFAMTATPAIVAWAFPFVHFLRRILVCCYLSVAAILLAVTVSLTMDGISNDVRLAMVIAQGAVSGIAMPGAIAFLWEAIGRGTDESRRGLALSLAFGAGPLLAVAGSLLSQLLLSGSIGSFEIDIEYPWNFATLFGAGVPVMVLAAFLSSRFVLPTDIATVPSDDRREPFSKVADLCAGIVFGLTALACYRIDDFPNAVGHVTLVIAGLLFVRHFRDILGHRELLLATIVTVLLYSGNTIPTNMNLYTSEVIDARPEDFAGYQNTLRFAFKVAAGFLLGWLLVRTNPRAGVLMTGVIFVAAQLWAIFATGKAYLIAFGIYGAGELVGVYAPNYILSASPRSSIRRNMAFATMLMVPAAPTGYLFGAISDYVTDNNITLFGIENSRALGFQASFAVCAIMMVAGLVVAVVLLPPRPSPPEQTNPGG